MLRLNFRNQLNFEGFELIIESGNSKMHSQYFYNDSHLNYNGQVIITHAIGKYLMGWLK